jgi:hypothetical protein
LWSAGSSLKDSASSGWQNIRRVNPEIFLLLCGLSEKLSYFQQLDPWKIFFRYSAMKNDSQYDPRFDSQKI